MKLTTRNSTLTALLAIVISTSVAVQGDELADDAAQAVKDLQRADSSLKQVMDGAAGYAIFPSVGRAGFIIGGERGKGLVYQQGKLVGKTKVTEVNIGAQAGAEKYSELIIFETSEALRDFKSSDWEMSAKVNAVVAAEGAAKNAKYQQGVAVFTLTKGGAMLQASVGGQKFKYEPLE